MDNTSKSFGKRLKRLRTAAGLSTGQLGRLIEADSGRESVRRWEMGTATPNLRFLVPLARALDASYEELLGPR